MKRFGKIILSLLFLGFSHNVVALDWLKFSTKNILKVSTGAVLGGAGAVISGLSVPLVAISAVVGSWVNFEWQNNHQLLKELSVANQNLDNALKNTQDTVLMQDNLQAELNSTLGVHRDMNREIGYVSNKLREVESHLGICKSVGENYTKEFESFHNHLATVEGKVSEVNKNLLYVADSQREYEKNFQSIVMQGRMRSAYSSFAMALQYRQMHRILQQQDQLNVSLQNNGRLLSKVAEKDQDFFKQYSSICLENSLVRQNLEQNLAKQKQLEQELAQILAAKDLSVCKMESTSYIRDVLVRSFLQVPKSDAAKSTESFFVAEKKQ